MASPEAFALDIPTLLCLSFALSFLPLAYIFSTLLPTNSLRNRVLFFWHAYDALTHIFIEGSFLYECFFSYATLPPGFSTPSPHFLSRSDRVYGAAYGTGPSARLWQEYAKADHRWAVADAGVISLELLTVFLGGPAAVYVCYLLWRSSSETLSARARGSAKATLWLVMTALATAELYGGFMTFAPEWLTGSEALATQDPVYLWLYLFFFNTLWVWMPIWVLWEAGKELTAAFVVKEVQLQEKKD
ncbi:hypothetical protein N7468_006896 [Penicillium chermesinum]|uniref:EXPERA domain-containing protein n=1 Tax=Penicillium chermesinum TaxID=63820 RepID=A0A9W9NTT4_9EURO|nr:uncharacterized protein N7468_006896 [Penicillium chermesinum]KAJ5225671.1 hypothetical protein N7468_006896 [Penicillium chermesinum]KAJ6161111.1 hypothetical protein N7470_004507 [Penicillium chermesinum]